MPKGKNAAALFEVINKSRGLRTDSKTTSSSPPKWWQFNKANNTTFTPTSSTPPAPPAAPVASQSGASVAPVSSAQVAPSAPSRSVPLGIVADPIGDESDAPVVVDADQQQIKLKLSYSTVIIAIVALIVLISLAVVIGRKTSPAAQRESTEQIQAGPISSNALNATPGQGAASNALIDPDPAGLSTPPPTPTQTTPRNEVKVPAGLGTGSGTTPGGAAPTMPNPTAGSNPAVGGATANGAVTPPSKVNRIVNLNYIIVQSYPLEADAKAVVDLLASKGIPTTIERGLSGYPKWCIVVTTEGFPKPTTPEYVALRKKIDQISAEQARKERKWIALTPQGYRWK